jgi:leucyl aminopeptidase (aminopeptidase T)
MPFEQLEAALLPALLAPAEELADEARRVLKTIGGRQELSILTGNDCVLHLQQGERAWLIDDGLIDPEDRRRGAIVSNLPAGSIYSTVLESETRGCLWLPKAGEAKDVTLHFQEGRIVDIQAAIGAEELKACLFRHTGEPGRVSHIGIGLNPYLRQPVGWDIPVDEHVYGYMFIALGENRYMGGVNESSLNVDFMISGATFMAGDRAIVYEGEFTK